MRDWRVPIKRAGLRAQARTTRARGDVIRKLLGGGKAVSRRRGVPIMAYVGPNGSGKSLAAVRDTLPSLERGRRVLSTVQLLDKSTGKPHPLCELFTDWRQLLAAEHCDVLMDEVTGIASSRDSSALPSEVANVLVQLRKRDVQLRWTTPSWSRADRIIREVTQAVTMCTGLVPDRSVLKRPDTDVGLWLPNRLFRLITIDAAQLEDELSETKRQKARRLAFELWWGPGSDAFDSYETRGAVTTVGETLQKGICFVCGGLRSPDRCRGGHSDAEVAEALQVLGPGAARLHQPVELRVMDGRSGRADRAQARSASTDGTDAAPREDAQRVDMMIPD